MLKLIANVLLALSLFFTIAPTAQAQQAVLPQGNGAAADVQTTLSDITPEKMTELVARMSDDALREFVMEQFMQLAASNVASQEAPLALVDKVKTLWTAFYRPILGAIFRLPILFDRQGDAFVNFAQTQGGASGVLILFGMMALILACAYGAERLVRWRLNASLKAQETDSESSLVAALRYLFGRFIREVFGLIIFIIVARLAARFVLDPTQVEFAGPFIFYFILIPRLTAAMSRFVLAPNRSDLRLVTVNDMWAKFFHRNVIGLILLACFNVFAMRFSLDNGVLPRDTFLGFWLDSAVYIYIIFIAWVARDGLSEMMQGSDPDRTPFDDWMTRLYPKFVIGVAAATWVLVIVLIGLRQAKLVLEGAHYVTMFWLIMAPAFDTAIRGIVRHLVPPMIGEGPLAEKAYVSNKRSMIRIGRVVVIGLVIVIVANAWHVPLLEIVSQRPGFGDNILSFLLTAVVGYIAYEVISLWINRLLARENSETAPTEEGDGGEIGGAGASRLSTVLPLLDVTAKVAIGVVFGLLAIGNLGVDITPLLAGAGIAGLAIGFGAQKLVADIVSGVFFLVDDAFRLGEYIEISGTMGAVEKISIRSMQLRHHNGPVHTIPYGEIPQLTNFSRDWVILKLKFTVTFDTDPNKVKKIFKKIGADMMEHPELGQDFLQPFKSQGVANIDEVGMVVRGKFMAKPGKQFMIRKEIYNRVKAEFEAAGIDFARREVRVDISGLDGANDLSKEDKAAIATAASAAAQSSVQAGATPA